MTNDSFFVGIYEPLDVRRNLLESSKEIIKSIEVHETLDIIRKEKLILLKEMKRVMTELDMLIERLEKKFPAAHLRKTTPSKKVRKSTTKPVVHESEELKKLGDELKKIEDALHSK